MDSSQLTNPKHILTTLHLIRASLATDLLTKEEVIEWADKIIITDEQPDIFFIDLALSGSKSTKEILSYLNEYLDFEKPAIPGRPLVGLLYKKYKSGEIDLTNAVRKLYQLNFEAIFTDEEESYLYTIEDELDCAKSGIYGTIEDVQHETEKFMAFYKDYSFENFAMWEDLDKHVEIQIEADNRLKEEQAKFYNQSLMLKSKPWWRFW
jgi:hypothetical protein